MVSWPRTRELGLHDDEALQSLQEHPAPMTVGTADATS